jgi:hypothetical protein
MKKPEGRKSLNKKEPVPAGPPPQKLEKNA